MKVKVKKLKTVAFIALTIWSMSSFAQGTQAYFKKDGATVFQTSISDIDSIVFKQITSEEYCQSFDNQQGVVINGVRWATRNVGAPGTFASSPCDYGEYYQFNKGTTNFLLDNDYNNSIYANSDSWLPANDPSPAGWRVPTFDEIQKLLDTNYVTCEWIDNNGLTGEKFTDNATGNSIFLPAAGCRSGSDGALYDAGDSGEYWSGTVDNTGGAYGLELSDGIAYWWIGYSRYYGFSVRPVTE